MTLRVAILGASSIAPSALVEPAARSPRIEVVSIAAKRPGAAAEFATRWGIPRSETDYDAVLGDPAVDAVYNSLAASDHAAWTIAALEAGKHVLCEKPAALTRAEALAISAAGSDSGRLVIEAFHYRWHPLFARVRELVADPAFGRPVSMSSTIVGSVPFARGSVLHEPSLGGGAHRHSGCYAVHWMRLLAGAEPSVTAFSARGELPGADTESTVELEFADGLRGTVLSSFERSRTPSDAPELVVESAESRIEVRGLISPHHGHSLLLQRAGEVADVTTVAGRTSYDHQLDAFVAALDDPAAARSARRDLVAQASVLESASRIRPGGNPLL